MLLMLSWTELMKHAEHCGFASIPTLNQTGRVEAHLLVDQEVGQLRLERGEVLVRGEVALGLGPGGDRVDDAVDELPDAVLALRRADVAAEVLADDDVGGELAPGGRDLDVLLLEHGLAGLGADAGRPVLPGDLVVGVDAGAGPAALEREAARPLAGEAGTVRAAEPLAGGGRLVPVLPPRDLGVTFSSMTGTTSRAWAIPVLSSAPAPRDLVRCCRRPGWGSLRGDHFPGCQAGRGVRAGAPSGWRSRGHEGGDRSCGAVRRIVRRLWSSGPSSAVLEAACPGASGVVRRRGDR